LDLSVFGPYVKRDDFFDGLGRPLQTQRDAVVGGASSVVASGTVRFDTLGNADLRYAPFTTSRTTGTGGIALLKRAPANTGTTVYQYDTIRRVTRVTNPDSTYRLMDYTIPWQTTTKDECYTAGAPSCPGSKVVERRDGFGRVVEKQLYKGDTFETRTGYTYDVLGRLKETKQGKTPTTWQTASPDTRVTTTYDSLGRKIQTVDPDSGTWKYGYDLVGNLLYQDDPKSAQSLLFKYDALNRVTRKVYRGSEAYCDLAQPSCTGTGDKIEYAYDSQSGGTLTCLSDVCPSGVCALGRLTAVNEYTVASPTVPGNSTAFCYDVRGRQRQVATTLAVNGSLPLHGETRYTYDRADHVLTMRYPDGQETVTYTYDEVGQVIGMDGTNSSGQAVVYLDNQTYDRFGRPLQVAHSNNVTDFFSYHDTSENFRLQQIETKLGTSTTLQKLTYDQYHDNGLIKHVTDGVYTTASTLSNTAQFDYDGLGRLTQVSAGTSALNGTYAQGDQLDNLTSKDGTTLTYGTTAPHRVTSATGGAAPYGALGYDANGNRSSIANPGRSYGYTADDRLAQVTGGVSLNFAYDYTGNRTAKIVNPGASQQVTWYFGDLMEVSDRFVTKSYFAAGRRIASQRYWRPVGFLAMSAPAVQVAGLPGGHGPLLVLTLRRDVQVGAGLTVLLAVALLCALPGRRKVVVGIALRRGHVILVLLAFTASALPVPIVVTPAWAQSPTPTPTGGDTLGIMHYHLDHLGSTQVITTQSGTVFRHIRYTAYGTVRGPWNASGALASGCADHEYCHEYTGYDTEPLTNLRYAGARFYDPGVGMFVTHDPARQFASPYAYGPWDPVNGVDPTGAFFGIDDIIYLVVVYVVIPAAIGAAVSSIVAAAQGRDVGQAAATGALGGAIAGPGALGGGLGLLISGAASGAATSALNGGNPGTGALVGAIAGIAGSIGGGGGAYGFKEALIGAGEGAAVGCIGGELQGGGCGQGAATGTAVGGALGFATSEEAMNTYGGFGFKTNEQVIADYAAAGNFQAAIDYAIYKYGLDGSATYDASLKARGRRGETDPVTGNVSIGPDAIAQGLPSTLKHEFTHRADVLAGRVQFDAAGNITNRAWLEERAYNEA
jgi:RHS repeat-associated protein